MLFVQRMNSVREYVQDVTLYYAIVYFLQVSLHILQSFLRLEMIKDVCVCLSSHARNILHFSF